MGFGLPAGPWTFLPLRAPAQVPGAWHKQGAVGGEHGILRTHVRVRPLLILVLYSGQRL
jgi:hypothetical protein